MGMLLQFLERWQAVIKEIPLHGWFFHGMLLYGEMMKALLLPLEEVAVPPMACPKERLWSACTEGRRRIPREYLLHMALLQWCLR